MQAKSGFFKLGLFVLGAVALAIVGLLLLGAGQVFRETVDMETYLDESVQGLSVGSPVKERGVQIGIVSEIDFARNVYDLGADRENLGRYVVVKMSLPAKGKFQPDRVHDEIERGLRVRLVAQGITGQLYLEVDYRDVEDNPPLPITWVPDSLYIPSTQSAIARIGSAVDGIIEQVERTDIENIASDLDDLILTVTRSVEGARVQAATREAELLIKEMRETNQELKKLLASRELQGLPKELDGAVKDMRRTTRRLDNVIAGNQEGITETVENLRSVSQEMKELTSNAREYPSFIFFGEPPARSSADQR